MGVIAVASCGAGRHRALDPGEVLWRQVEVERSERLGQPLTATRPDQRNDGRAAGQHPGDRDLCDRRALRIRDRAQRLDERKVAVEVVAAEPREVRTEVALSRGPFLRPMAAQETARQDAVSGDADAELATGRQDLRFDSAREERLLDLQVGDRMDGMGAAHGVGAGLRESDMSDVPGLYHVRDCADGVLDGTAGSTRPRR